MSYDAFRDATTVRSGGRIGLNRFGPTLSRERLVMIDINLYAWWCVSDSDRAKKIKATLRVLRACGEWARKHQTKKGASRTGAQRMPVVKLLRDQCWAWLATLGVVTQRPGYTAPGKLKGLDKPYLPERAMYKDAKSAGQKINPIGGSFVHDAQKSEDAEIAKLAGKPMDQMTTEDYERLALLAFPDDPTRARTLYMDAADRTRHLALIIDGELADLDGKPFANDYIYAMDKYGSLYVTLLDDALAAQNKNSRADAGFINHSGFLAGKDVICAGTIEKVWMTEEKRAVPNATFKITTNSGHYKPDADNLKTCLKSLELSGLDLTKYAAFAGWPPPRFERAADCVR